MWAVALLTAGCFKSANLAPDAGAVVPCNDLSPGAVLVETTSRPASSAPVASGGTLEAGLYHLISSSYFPSTVCTLAAVATQLRVAPASETTGTLDIVTGTASGDTLSETVSYTVSGASLSVRIECIVPDPTGLRGSSSPLSFSASARELRLFKSTPNCGTSVDTYVADTALADASVADGG